MDKQLEGLLEKGFSVARTNLFRVTDEAKYAELFANICGEHDEMVYDMTTEDEYGFTLHAFSVFDEVIFEDYAGCDAFKEEFIPALQEILPETEAFLMVAHHILGRAKLHSHVYIVTKDDFQVLIMDELVRDKAEEMLGDNARYVHFLDDFLK